MEGRTTIRWLMAAVAGGAGLVAAVLLGAPPIAAVVASVAGAAALIILFRTDRDRMRAVAPVEPQSDAPPAGLTELMRAIDEPMLLVRDRLVLAANEAAFALSGSSTGAASRSAAAG